MKRLALALMVGCGAAPTTTTQPSAASTVAAALRAALAEVCATAHPAEPAARLALALTCALLAPPAEVPDAGHGG